METSALFVGACVLLGGLLWGANCLYMRTPHYQNQVHFIQKFIQGVPNDLCVMNTGSNHALFSIDWTLVNVRGFNLASGAQSLSWDDRLLKKYHSHLQPGGVILFVLSDLVLAFSEYADPRADRRYYCFMKSREIPRYTHWRAVQYHYLPVLEHWRNVIHCFYHRGAVLTEHVPSPEYADQASNARIEGWKQEFHLPDLRHRTSAAHLHDEINRTSSLLRRMVDEMKGQGYHPILMIPPMSMVINKKIGVDFLDEVLYHPLRQKFTDVPLLDYMHDERFQDYRLYQNGDFMNQEGRKVFMPVLWHDIQSCIGKKDT